MSTKKTLSSGDIAEYCDVNLRTVIRWIAKGHLKAYKLPGRGNNRVLLSDFIEFLNNHKMPVPSELRPQRLKALVIDDDKSMASAIKRVLRKSNFEVEIAHDGLQAGVKLAEFQPSLLTLDLKMPNMDGFEVLKYLKKSPFKHMKILVLSGAGEEALARAKALGADIVMEKPFENEQLTQSVNTLFAE